MENLLSGYVPEYLYERGRIDTSLPFPALKRRSRINAAAQTADAAGFLTAHQGRTTNSMVQPDLKFRVKLKYETRNGSRLLTSPYDRAEVSIDSHYSKRLVIDR
jgi:hypothetical protein